MLDYGTDSIYAFIAMEIIRMHIHANKSGVMKMEKKKKKVPAVAKKKAAHIDRKKLQKQLILTELRFFRQTRNELNLLRRMDVKPVSTQTLLHMEKTVFAIETALLRTRRLSEGKARVHMLRMKYWDYGNTTAGIMMDTHVTKSTYYKWHTDFVTLVGELMGIEL